MLNAFAGPGRSARRGVPLPQTHPQGREPGCRSRNAPERSARRLLEQRSLSQVLSCSVSQLKGFSCPGGLWRGFTLGSAWSFSRLERQQRGSEVGLVGRMHLLAVVPPSARGGGAGNTISVSPSGVPHGHTPLPSCRQQLFFIPTSCACWGFFSPVSPLQKPTRCSLESTLTQVCL